ncbi:MAG: hypothetical protein HZA32_12910 [Opitutae bacterium]|nr:hypothetical protein [Opitutae bacterium]
MDAPTGIQLEVEFLDRLNEPVREGKAKSVSEIIRTALERFNFENVVVLRPSHVTISVRLPSEVRRDLKRVAREKHTSIGQLVRIAVDTYLPQLEEASAGQLEIEMSTAVPREPEPPPSPKAPVAAARPAAKDTRKKAPARKSAAKRAAKTPPKPAASAKKKRAR